MRVTVDADQCGTTGYCVAIAPDIFRQRESDGVSEAIQPEPPADRYEDVHEAELSCPVAAIRIHRGDGQ